MGTNISGALIVGAHFSDVCLNYDEDEFYDDVEFLEGHDIDIFSPHYDADIDDSFIGFRIENVDVGSMDSVWFDKIKKLSGEFERLAGCKARLIGCQKVS